MTMGSELKRLRRERGMTQELLAANLGVSRQAVAKWEADAAYPSTENLLLLSEVLDVDVSTLASLRPSARGGADDAESRDAPGRGIVLLRRHVPCGNITMHPGTLVVVTRAMAAYNDKEDCYSIDRMSQVQIVARTLTFRYARRWVHIPLGDDATNWVTLIADAKNGVWPQPEPIESTRDYIVAHYTERQLVEAVKYWLDMEGGTRRTAVTVVREILTGNDGAASEVVV